MSLFGKIVRTTINTAVLPFSVLKDVGTLGSSLSDCHGSYVVRQLEKIKEEAED